MEPTTNNDCVRVSLQLHASESPSVWVRQYRLHCVNTSLSARTGIAAGGGTGHGLIAVRDTFNQWPSLRKVTSAVSTVKKNILNHHPNVCPVMLDRVKMCIAFSNLSKVHVWDRMCPLDPVQGFRGFHVHKDPAVKLWRRNGLSL